MSKLLDELKERRAGLALIAGNYREDVLIVHRRLRECEAEIADLDTAIAALSPAAAQAAEPSTRYETTVVNGEHAVVGTLKRGDDLPMEDHRLSAQEIPEGFTKWEGGECPVDESALVEYQLRGADSPPLDPKPAFLLRWNHAGVAGDIIAYRISPELAGEEHDDPTAVAIAAHIDGQFDDEAQPDPADLPLSDEQFNALDLPEMPEGFTRWTGERDCPEPDGTSIEAVVVKNSGERVIEQFVYKAGVGRDLDTRWAWMDFAGVDRIIAYRIIEAQPDPADLPPPTEAEFNALPKFESVFVSEQPVSEEILERVREHFEENPPQVLAYAEPAPVVSELDEGAGR